jgi:hypothetical protein
VIVDSAQSVVAVFALEFLLEWKRWTKETTPSGMRLPAAKLKRSIEVVVRLVWYVRAIPIVQSAIADARNANARLTGAWGLRRKT